MVYELVIRAEDLNELIDALPLIKSKLAQGFQSGLEGNEVYYDLKEYSEIWERKNGNGSNRSNRQD